MKNALLLVLILGLAGIGYAQDKPAEPKKDEPKKEAPKSEFKITKAAFLNIAKIFNDYKGTKPVAQGASVIVKYAILDETGPTGKYFSEEGETPW